VLSTQKVSNFKYPDYGTFTLISIFLCTDEFTAKTLFINFKTILFVYIVNFSELREFSRRLLSIMWFEQRNTVPCAITRFWFYRLPSTKFLFHYFPLNCSSLDLDNEYVFTLVFLSGRKRSHFSQWLIIKSCEGLRGPHSTRGPYIAYLCVRGLSFFTSILCNHAFTLNTF
jgi:hypothetical protein